MSEQNPNWADTFSVEVSDGGGEIVVRRIDSAGGWGQPLEVRCVASQMEALQQLMNFCEDLDTRVVLDLVEDLLGNCPLVQMDCTGVTGCRGGPPLQCAAAPGAGEQQLAELITVGEEIAYTGRCLGSVDGGGWTFVNEEGHSTTDLSDVTQEMAGGKRRPHSVSQCARPHSVSHCATATECRLPSVHLRHQRHGLQPGAGSLSLSHSLSLSLSLSLTVCVCVVVVLVFVCGCVCLCLCL